jgi:hypothetical protein
LTGIFAAVALAASSVSLLRNYRFPKQDFEGAMHFVDAEKKAGDTVVTAGASTYPYQEYYDKHWDSVENAAKLREIAGRSPDVWMVYTMPRYLEAAAPDVMEMIRTNFKTVRIFPGTVGDGDVYVSKYRPGVK